MTTGNAYITQSDALAAHTRTGLADGGGLAKGAPDQEVHRAGWERIIDYYLVEWGRDPGQLEDEDFVPPAREIVERAVNVAMSARDTGWAAPLRVVPDGEGGIVFERHCGDTFQSLRVDADQSVELITFKDCRLVSRVRLQ